MVFGWSVFVFHDGINSLLVFYMPVFFCPALQSETYTSGQKIDSVYNQQYIF